MTTRNVRSHLEQARNAASARWRTLAVAAASSLAALQTGCESSSDACLSDREFFAQKIWAPIVSQKCYACHNGAGVAASTDLVLKGIADAGFLDSNFEVMKSVASLERDGTSVLLLKPTKRIDHYGGELIELGSDEYAAFEELVRRFDNPSSCSDDTASYFEAVELKTPRETLRKAALLLIGRLPTDDEYAAIDDANIDSIAPVLFHYMEQPAFFDRLREIYNDLFLTDRYLGGGSAIDLLQSDYYAPYWFDQLADVNGAMTKYGALSPDNLRQRLQSWTNRGVAREPLELVVHVVKNDLPFTEIVTADYMMVNPFSAQAYGVTPETPFANDADPTEYQPARLTDYPHAGVLSSPMFLNRFPTTATNRNRHRSRMVYQFFLGTDILKTAEQPIDPTKATGFNPTLYNPACTVCHGVIDPLAGAFHSFNAQGVYNPESVWFNDMMPPGFGSQEVPYEQFPIALPWAAARIANDDRFALATTFNLYRALTGQKPLLAPDHPEAQSFQRDFDEYLVQYQEFSVVAEAFRAANYDLKALVAMLVKTPYFRAKNATATDSDALDAVRELGSAQLLSPELLHRKVRATLGIPWRPNAFNEFDSGNPFDYLLRSDQYRLLYGGIDSNDVTVRITAPNGVMANVAERMANEMACKAVPLDFQKPREERLLFTEVDADFMPEDVNGFEITEAKNAILQQIANLHLRLLGEDLGTSDPEIERAYQLFVETWREGNQALSQEPVPEGWSPFLPWPCQVNEDYWSRVDLPAEEILDRDENYTIRAWMAVVSYMLGDYQFLYE